MKNLWQKWSYEIPLAIGDALWEVLVVQFAAFLDRLTVRKVVEFVAIALLVMAFAQTLPIDLAFLFAGDTLMYLEFMVAIRLAAGRMHIRAMLNQAMRFARLAFRAVSAMTAVARWTISRVARLRERSAARPSAKPHRTSDNSDDGGFRIAWGPLAAA